MSHLKYPKKRSWDHKHAHPLEELMARSGGREKSHEGYRAEHPQKEHAGGNGTLKRNVDIGMRGNRKQSVSLMHPIQRGGYRNRQNEESHRSNHSLEKAIHGEFG